ncbi:DeoR/GlpR family DNA-binding transcription regulator [Traorella massiliensis]|uniref:DeoR/GlpR family DNA-binding transcription regulator n=1 Tax=Traorella massiliensis TaxID=1903263 RepID=UPI002356B365|nr:DeoR/GlpR family DNA-binding transcription regulator [Traorella massiliensis]
MYQEERQKYILDYVTKNKKASTKELSDLLNTSLVTIRTDLRVLQEKGLLVKTHGGVMINSYKINDVIPSDIKFQKHKKEKRKIAEIANRYINDGDILIIDSGSTTLELAKCINAKNLTVFTNDLQIALELSKKKDVSVNVSGGSLIPGVYTLTGYDSVDFYKGIHVEKLFLSCDAIDADFGISNRDIREVEIKKAMLKSANEVFMMADHSKMNAKVLIKVTGFENIDKLIADEIPKELRDIISSKGVEVITE